MRIIIACSGAGGHLSCGISIAGLVKERYKNAEIFFLNGESKLAKSLVAAAGHRFYRVYAKGLLNRNLLGDSSERRLSLLGMKLLKKGLFQQFQFLFSQLVSILHSFFLFLLIRPFLVIGAGGYSQVGIIFWSRLFGTPIVIHEQNVIPGRANRLAAGVADKVLVSFSESRAQRGFGHARVCGMPVRFKNRLNKKEKQNELSLVPGRFTILVMGGSSGAHRLNQLMIASLEKLVYYKDKIQFIHLAGAKDVEFVREGYKKYGFVSYVETFHARMDVIYSSSDMAISRAGSSSIFEMSFFRLPCILIPYPHTKDRHQQKNAEAVAKLGAGIVITEEECNLYPIPHRHPADTASPDKLVSAITDFVNGPEKLTRMSKQSGSLYREDTPELIMKEIEELVKGRAPGFE